MTVSRGKSPRIALVLTGRGKGLQRIKNEPLIAALTRLNADLQVWSVSRNRWARAISLVRNFSPNRATWKARHYGHPTTFDMRTQSLQKHIADQGADVDVVLQIGATFDATHAAGHRPVVIYTDYTNALSVRLGRAYRAPFKDREIDRLIAQERQTVSAAASICVRSDLVRRSMIDDYGIAEEKLHVIGGGANLPVQRPTAPSSKFPPFRVLFVGSEFRRKGGDTLLASINNPELKDLLRVDIVTHPAHHRETPNVTWHYDLSDRALANLMSSADIFVAPSRLETWGDALVEAMHAACACVASDIPPLNEILDHGVSGLLFPTGDEDALARALMRLAKDDALRQQMQGVASAKATHRYTWDSVATSLAAQVAAVWDEAGA